MADYVTLMGAHEVGRAGGAMIQAGDRMICAAGEISEALNRLRQDLYDNQNFLNDWLERFTTVLAADREDRR